MKRKFIVIFAVVFVAAVAGFFTMLSQRPEVRSLTVTVYEFGYRVDGGEPTIRMKAGEEVRILFENRGTHDHEFLLVRDKDEAIGVVEKKLEAGASDAELDRLKAEMALMGVRFESEPGGTSVFRLRLTEPGTYYFLCLETEPDEEPHANLGEIGVIVVE
ncbi:conserved hypothetical protein [Candidatus Caldarchaeum subterraneum]|uniref:EfeO-type cupredoxin-like domain-containing protein n=1 Tax=Caldiarchaeum subterraneum TaxID=311458 RepID=E6N4H3_CALS0|nr:conserved hypothetical protein [Candidatus Caldarchaeum subterraneum]BAJ47263.1 conserved hypothetical protein [Candidatus Caldarchaeum subterraneum]BAJ50071.1 conserved hypothetical protein [Candidatus Caldarchaeum subterraneum]